MVGKNTHILVWGLFLVAMIVFSACSGGTVQNRPPIASFSAGTTGGNPLAWSFDASSSTDSDGSVASYAWTFGDGGSGTGATANHTYATGGTYTVTLTVTDNAGATGSTNQTLTQTGSISGTISVGGSSPAGQAIPQVNESMTRLSPRWQPDIKQEFRPGEIIVKFSPSVRTQGLSTLQVGSIRLDRVRSLALASTELYRSVALDKAATIELVRQLNARSDVAYAQPNYILFPTKRPNDELYSLQWHYPAMNLEAAWDISTGSASTVVAVLDTGILFEEGNAARTHPDFVGKVLPGYDFISDPQVANDGDGRDANAFDNGDNLQGQSSYHGSHVAGTVAAATDNTTGVAGVDWQAKILPVRVLGAGGGSIADIVDAVLWSAGLSVSGVPANANPADVLNLSLGGPGFCSPFEQDGYDQVIAAGAIVVVAAGNENQNAGGFSPASCSGVITVGATDFAGARAPYSNFGSRIDVMAPGGDTQANLNGDIYVDGVLSPIRDDPSGDFIYAFYQGTSMASPHVAGLVSLMKSVNASLTAPQALQILQTTAKPLTAAQCNGSSQTTLTANDCGAGLVDALAALQNADNPTPPPATGNLTFDPNPLDFGTGTGTDVTELQLTLINTGGASVNWQITAFSAAPDNPGATPDGTLFLPAGAPNSGTIAAGGQTTTTIGLDRTKVTTEGFYQLDLLVDVDGSEERLPVRFSIAATGPVTLNGPMIVASFVEDDAGNFLDSGLQVEENFFSTYGFEVLIGANIVIAWSDENDNIEIDSGDYIGIASSLVNVEPGESVTGVDFNIDPVLDIGALDFKIASVSSEEIRSVLTRFARENRGVLGR